MQRTCEVCGQPFDGIRASARICGPTCRKRASRAAGKTKPPAAKLATVAHLPNTQGSARLGSPISVERALVAELGDLVDTTLGQGCLLIARRLDAGTDPSGAAVASLFKQLETMKAEAFAILASRQAIEADEDDPIVWLRLRAQERAKAAGA